MEQTKQGRRYFRTSTKVLAAVLAAVMVVSIAANIAVTVKIKSGDQTDAATNYLADSTEYVGEDRLTRLAEWSKTLQAQKDLEDYYRLASTQIASANYGAALGSIERCLEVYPGGDQATYQDLIMKKACLLVLLDRPEEALPALDEALSLDSSLSDVYLIKAQIYAAQQDMPHLAEALVSYLKLEPEDNDVRALLAQAQFTAEDYQGATEQYRRILDTAEEETDTTEVAYLYGLTCIQTGDYQAAETYLSRALEQDDTLEGIYYYRGTARMSLGRYKSAEQDFTASLNQNSLPQLSYYSRGLCRMMAESGDYDGAKADLKKAAETGDSAEVRRQAQTLLTQLKDAEDEAARAQAAAEAEELARQAAETQGTAEGGAASSEDGTGAGASSEAVGSGAEAETGGTP